MNETVTVLRPNFVRRLAEATVVTVEQLSEEKLQQNHPLADMSLCGERPWSALACLKGFLHANESCTSTLVRKLISGFNQNIR